MVKHLTTEIRSTIFAKRLNVWSLTGFWIRLRKFPKFVNCFSSSKQLYQYVVHMTGKPRTSRQHFKSRSSHWSCSKKVCCQKNLQENTCVEVPFLIKLQTCNFAKKRLQCFLVSFAKFLEHFFLMNTFVRMLLEMAFVLLKVAGNLYIQRYWKVSSSQMFLQVIYRKIESDF